jgi:hypothetical protein
MIYQAQCTIFKQNLYNGLENFSPTSPYVYKIALYNGNADLSSSTLTYTTTNEVTGPGYTAGGEILTVSVVSSDLQNNTAYVSFNNVSWYSASFTTAGALIYNSTTNAAVAVLNFGNNKTATNNTFTIAFPTANSTSAVIRSGQNN